MNGDLLEYAKLNGHVDRQGFDREISAIKEKENDIIICTCSTYGDLCDPDNMVFRIDQPIGKYIVSNYSEIGIAFTAASTKSVSRKMIIDIANAAQKTINIHEINCEDCWTWFKQDEREKYETEIAKKIKMTSGRCEVVFLAQASMEGTKKYLAKEKYEVVSSPVFGMRKYIELFKSREDKTKSI